MVRAPRNDDTLVDALASGNNAQHSAHPLPIPLLQQLDTLRHRRQLIGLPRHVAVVAGAQLAGGELEEGGEIEADETAGGPGREIAVRSDPKTAQSQKKLTCLLLFPLHCKRKKVQRA